MVEKIICSNCNGEAINKCPYELATDLKLTKNNKWLELIELSKRAI
jgi:hypothetical protein